MLFRSYGYASLSEHNIDVLDKINNIVGENDILFHLGDICLNTNEEQFEILISSIKCKNIYYVWGNHSNPLWSIYKKQVEKTYNIKDIEVYPFKYKNITFVGNYLTLIYKKQMYVMTHYPLKTWICKKHNAINLHGHIHSNKNYINNITEKCIDVGWKAFNKPIHLNEIQEITKNINNTQYEK